MRVWTLKLHQRTIDKCERLYSSKAEAHFYGIGCGILIGFVLSLLIVYASSCAAKQPASIQPEMRVVVVHDKFQGCVVSGKTATCECSPVSTKIDSKTGKTTVMCRFHVENPQ